MTRTALLGIAVALLFCTMLMSASAYAQTCQVVGSAVYCSNGVNGQIVGNSVYWYNPNHPAHKYRAPRESGGVGQGFANGFSSGLAIGQARRTREMQQKLDDLDRAAGRLNQMNDRAKLVIECQNAAIAKGQDNTHCLDLFD